MKKLLLFITIITFFSACTETKKPTDEVTVTHAVEIKDTIAIAVATPIIDTPKTELEEPEIDITAKDSIHFEKYAVEVQELINKAPIDFSSYPEAKLFKTRITDAYNDGTTIDLAGHYIASTFGCGAGCIMGFMVDVRDGKIYDLPLGEENSCFWSLDRAIGKADSMLFISAICKDNEDDKMPIYKAYVWNEDKKNFEKVDSKEFLIKK